MLPEYPAPHAPKPVRPTGVVVAAVLLGLAAGLLILFSLGGLAASSMVASGTVATPGSGVSAAILAGNAAFHLVLAGWAISTLVGLVRMRSWARVSAIVIGFGVAALGLLGAVIFLFSQSLLKSGQFGTMQTAGTDPAVLHKVLLAMALFSAAVAVLGASFAVYFLLRRVRDAFTLARMQQPAATAYPTQHAEQRGAPPAWPLAYTPMAQPPRDPLTDFTVARPLEPPAPAAQPTAAWPESTPLTPAQPWVSPPAASQPQWPGDSLQPETAAQPVPAGQPGYPASARSRRPVSVTIIAIVALLNACGSLASLASSLPLLVFGMLLRGWPAHIYSLVWATLMGIAGLGLLRLQRPAWMLSFGLLGVLALQYLVLLLPGARQRYIDYTRNFGHMPASSPLVFPASFFTVLVAFTVVFGIAALVLCAVLLWKARFAFAPVTPASADEQSS